MISGHVTPDILLTSSGLCIVYWDDGDLDHMSLQGSPIHVSGSDFDECLRRLRPLLSPEHQDSIRLWGTTLVVKGYAFIPTTPNGWACSKPSCIIRDVGTGYLNVALQEVYPSIEEAVAPQLKSFKLGSPTPSLPDERTLALQRKLQWIQGI